MVGYGPKSNFLRFLGFLTLDGTLNECSDIDLKIGHIFDLYGFKTIKMTSDPPLP